MTRREPSTRQAIRTVRAVVLSWNGGQDVVRCVGRLLETDWPAGDLEVVVVDNASTDGSDLALRRAHGDRFHMIRNHANTGFGANNLALDHRDGVDALALVNPDTEVDPGWLAPLAAELSADADLGAACPALLFAPRFAELEVRSPAAPAGAGDPRRLGVRLAGVEVDGVDRWADVVFADGFHDLEVGTDGPFRWTDGRARLLVPLPEGAAGPVSVRLRLSAQQPADVELIGGPHLSVVRADASPVWLPGAVDPHEPLDVVQNAGSVVFSDGAGADRCFGEPAGLNLAVPADVFAWCGGAVLLRSDYLDDVGLFHEPFFLYYEDTDLSWRGQARGWRYRFVPGSVVRHRHAASSGAAGTSSARFQLFNERNRLLLLVRNAPGRLVRRELRRFVADTVRTARREVVGPLRRGRPPRPVMAWRHLRALVSLLALLPREVGGAAPPPPPAAGLRCPAAGQPDASLITVTGPGCGAGHWIGTCGGWRR